VTIDADTAARKSARLRLLVVLTAIVALVAPATAFASGSSSTFFRTPSGNIRCETWAYKGRTGVSCVVLSERIPKPYQQRTDYHLWTLDSGIGVLDDYTRWKPHSTYSVLRYGMTLKRGAVTCLSRISGLRCASRRGHGYFLSRQRQRSW